MRGEEDSQKWEMCDERAVNLSLKVFEGRNLSSLHRLVGSCYRGDQGRVPSLQITASIIRQHVCRWMRRLIIKGRHFITYEFNRF